MHSHSPSTTSTSSAGVMPDTAAAKVSTGGHPQFLALQRDPPGLQLDPTRAGEASIRFSRGEIIK